MMGYLGCDEKIVRLLGSLYAETMSAVRVIGTLTDWFCTVIGVLKGCPLTPLSFIMLRCGLIICLTYLLTDVPVYK